MRLFSRSQAMFAPDDTGGAGPDEPVTDDKAAKPDSNDALRAVADTIRQAIEAGRAPAVAAAPAIVVPTGPDQATQQALAREADDVNARYDELVAAGKASEAATMREAFIRKVNTLTAPNPGDNVIVKTALALGERIARSDPNNAPIMTKWGDEVKRAVAAMSVEDQVSPAAWDKAVATVRSNHFQEIMDEQVTAKVEEHKRAFVPPPGAPGSRGQRTLTGAASKLSEEQLWGADLTGVSPEDYAKEVAREEAFDRLPFKERAKFPGYPVIDEPRGNSAVPPGKF